MIVIKEIHSFDNGLDGLRIDAGADVELGVVKTSGNGRHGVNIVESAPWMRQYDFPEDTDARELAEVLSRLRSLPQQERLGDVERSSLIAKWAARGLNVVGLASNIVTVASHPAIQPWITRWLQP